MRGPGGICFVVFSGTFLAGAVLCGAPAQAQVNGGGAGMGIAALVLGLVLLALYFLPALIGARRRITASGALFFVNLLFGWTILGWFLCLIWAATGATRAQDAFYERAAGQTGPDPVADRAYQEAYAKERARLDHEAAQNSRGQVPPRAPPWK
jgi:hypothetical protein